MFKYVSVVTNHLTQVGSSLVVQDGSGWTPLMIASSLKEGDALVDLLLSKDADVNMKSVSLTSLSEFEVRQLMVHLLLQISMDRLAPPGVCFSFSSKAHILRYRQPSIFAPLRTTSTQLGSSSLTGHLHESRISESNCLCTGQLP